MTHLPIAPVKRRAIAYFIDAAIGGVLGGVLTGILLAIAVPMGLNGMMPVLAIGGPIIALIMLAYLVVFLIMVRGEGSIGMRTQGTRLVQEDGSQVGFGALVLRHLIFAVTAGVVVGIFSPLFDGTGKFQGWHDKAVHTLMIDARRMPSSAAAAATTDFAGAPVEPHAAAAPAQTHPPQEHYIPDFLHQTMGSMPNAPTPPQPAVAGSEVPDYTIPARSLDARMQDTAPPVSPSSVAAASLADGVDETVVSPPAQAAVPAQAQPTVTHSAPAVPENLIAFVPGITQDAPPRRTPVAEPVEAPVAEPAQPSAPVEVAQPAAQPAVPAPAANEVASAAPAGIDAGSPVLPEHVDDTVVTPPVVMPADDDDLYDTRISVPGHRLIFTWDDGTQVTVSNRTIFGRNPRAEDGAVVVSVRDETLSLSKTHFEAAADASGGWVVDRGSTNGTTIVRDGAQIACIPGIRTPLKLGDAITIGDRIVTVGGYA